MPLDEKIGDKEYEADMNDKYVKGKMPRQPVNKATLNHSLEEKRMDKG